MFAKRFAGLTLTAMLLCVTVTGCGIPEMVVGIAYAKEGFKDMRRSSREKEYRHTAQQGQPKQWIEYSNDSRKRGDRLAEFWDDGYPGDHSEPYFKAYEKIFADGSATVRIINGLNDKGLVSSEEMKSANLYEQRNALRWLIARYKTIASNECVDAANEASGAISHGLIQNGETVAADAYRKLLEVIEGIPNEPLLPTLHYRRICGVVAAR